MALRSLDNALPAATIERTRKVPKISAVAAKVPRCSAMNDENAAPPPKVAEQSSEYIASEDLKALPDPKTKIASLLEELESRDWLKVCEALNDVRRLAFHHDSYLLPILGNVMLVIVKAMKSPRSALCKTSIMACTDIFHSFGNVVLSTSEESAFDQLLLQLLLKASQDKRFVCEEAEKSLEKMAVSVPPLPLLKKLQCYVNHSNLRVRAKAVVAISKCVSKMGIEIMKAFGLAALLQVSAELLNDRLPEAREAARSIITSIHAEFTRHNELKEGEESSDAESWQNFCSSNLPLISAQSVVKIVSQSKLSFIL